MTIITQEYLRAWGAMCRAVEMIGVLTLLVLA